MHQIAHCSRELVLKDALISYSVTAVVASGFLPVAGHRALWWRANSDVIKWTTRPAHILVRSLRTTSTRI